MTDKVLPDYDELPPASHGGRSGWGLFGADDNVGLVNLQTPERIVEAAKLVRRGAVFALDAPLDAFTHNHWGRTGLRHTVIADPGGEFVDDLVDNLFLQTASQWDSLAHVGYSPDVFYNGASREDGMSGRRNTIDHWARRGIVARAVLLDMVRTFEADGRPFEPDQGVAFSAEDFELARERAGVEIRPGDVLIFYTGYSRWFKEQGHAGRCAMEHFTCPGIEVTEPMCEYLWNLHISGLASDNLAIEKFPADHSPEAHPFGASHHMLIGQFGLPLGELWWLDALARDCAEDRVHEMLLVSSPLHVPGGIGSPANVIVIK